MTTEEFVERAKAVHGEKYDYSKVNYVDRNKTKVEIICPVHGSFWQLPGNHLAGKGCLKCSGRYQPTTEEFIKRANQTHNFKYDYSKVNYKNAKTKVEIICPEHGSFWQVPYCHVVRKQGCPICGAKPKDINHYLDLFKEVHGEKYDYSNSQIFQKNGKTFINIKCPRHGEYVQRVDQHLSGKGCPACRKSKGENYTEQVLIKNGIQFETEKSFEGLVGYNEGLLRFDFFLPELNAAIEYNGKQHYSSDEFFGGEEKLKEQQFNDHQKEIWCKEHGINLVVINKCKHGSFCKKDRRLIEEAVSSLIDKKV